MDSDKTESGICGCGVPDKGDSDGDSVLDCIDLCPQTPKDVPVDRAGCSILGACCFPIGVCFDDTDPNDCTAVGGTYQGLGSTCGVDCLDCNDNRVVDQCDMSCGCSGGPCDIPGCGTKVDCNANGIPDDCDIFIEQGGFCDPIVRDDCSDDINGDGRLEECPFCPVGVIRWIDPPDGVIAAGYPSDPSTCVANGIRAIVVQAPPGAEAVCWRLCETNDTGSLNFITNVTEVDGMYTLELDRPITPGACTTLSFTDNNNVTTTAGFISHPGNVNADATSNGMDVQFLLEILIGVQVAPWGLYSTDVDLSGGMLFPDVLGEIDILDGNGPCLEPWMNTSLPSCKTCPKVTLPGCKTRKVNQIIVTLVARDLDGNPVVRSRVKIT